MGRAVTKHCNSAGDDVQPLDHHALDIADAPRVIQVLQEQKPDAVFNCAAWTDVDGCELNPDRAYAANARGPENLAIASKLIGAVFITISTDYVFDGTKEGFYTQADQPNPESVYGKAKLEGELLAQQAYPRTIVVRTGFVFGSNGTNFLSTIVDRAARNEKLKAIKDCHGTPTYAPDLAVRLRELAKLDRAGTFHVVNDGPGVSYEEFARATLATAGYPISLVEGIDVDKLSRLAPRPRNSRLQCLLSPAAGLAPLPFWKNSLSEFVSSHTQNAVIAKP